MTKLKKPKKARVMKFLEMKDREKLIALLNDPVMQTALANIAILKPGAFFVGSGVGANHAKDAHMAALIANNRLHQIQGWEMFEAALFSQADEPKASREKLTETFSESV